MSPPPPAGRGGAAREGTATGICGVGASRQPSFFLSPRLAIQRRAETHLRPFILLINLHNRASQRPSRRSRLLRPQRPTRAGSLFGRRSGVGILVVVVEERVAGGVGAGSGEAGELWLDIARWRGGEGKGASARERSARAEIEEEQAENPEHEEMDLLPRRTDLLSTLLHLHISPLQSCTTSTRLLLPRPPLSLRRAPLQTLIPPSPRHSPTRKRHRIITGLRVVGAGMAGGVGSVGGVV